VRGKALSVSGATNWLFTFIVGLSFPIIIRAWYVALLSVAWAKSTHAPRLGSNRMTLSLGLGR
jgi:hypothetical protein